MRDVPLANSEVGARGQEGKTTAHVTCSEGNYTLLRDLEQELGSS